MKTEFKPQGDQVLADMFARFGIDPEPSTIVETDILSTVYNRETLGKGERIVRLSCRHHVITKNRKTVICPRCRELMRHGMDYDLWIRGETQWPDGLHWREDPLRLLNERTDLEGRFIDDPEEI